MPHRLTPAHLANTFLDMRRGSHRAGFTLIEMVVVLVLVGMGAALAMPALLRPRAGESGINVLVGNAREAAVRRGETLFLRIGASGEWRIEGAASSGAPDTLLTGKVDPLPVPLTLLVSPTGSCMLDVPSVTAAPDIQLDLLTCEVAVPPSSRAPEPAP